MIKDCKGKNNGFYGKKHNIETQAKMRAAHARRKQLGLYKPFTKEAKKNISEGIKKSFEDGRIVHNKGVRTVGYKKCEICKTMFYVKSHGDLKRRRFCSYDCLSDFNSKRMTGPGSPLWKGGITPINKAIRASREYRRWRKAVFERDNYTCQMCSIRGGYLQADHIKPFAYFSELRFELSNGRTLCKPCHEQTDTYMGRALKWSLS